MLSHVCAPRHVKRAPTALTLPCASIGSATHTRQWRHQRALPTTGAVLACWRSRYWISKTTFLDLHDLVSAAIVGQQSNERVNRRHADATPVRPAEGGLHGRAQHVRKKPATALMDHCLIFWGDRCPVCRAQAETNDTKFTAYNHRNNYFLNTPDTWNPVSAMRRRGDTLGNMCEGVAGVAAPADAGLSCVCCHVRRGQCNALTSICLHQHLTAGFWQEPFASNSNYCFFSGGVAIFLLPGLMGKALPTSTAGTGIFLATLGVGSLVCGAWPIGALLVTVTA